MIIIKKNNPRNNSDITNKKFITIENFEIRKNNLRQNNFVKINQIFYSKALGVSLKENSIHLYTSMHTNDFTKQNVSIKKLKLKKFNEKILLTNN